MGYRNGHGSSKPNGFRSRHHIHIRALCVGLYAAFPSTHVFVNVPCCDVPSVILVSSNTHNIQAFILVAPRNCNNHYCRADELD